MTLPALIKEDTPVDAVQEYVDNINNGCAKAKDSEIRGMIQPISSHQSNILDNDKSNPHVSS